jgi:uncharacterized protein involved in exopolysaccharide biosynthesis
MSITPVHDSERALNDDLVQLYDFFGALRARLLLIICTSLIFGAALTVAAFLMKPVYRGFAILAPMTSDTNPLTGGLSGSPLGQLGGGLLQLAGGLSEGDRETDEAMDVLRSREFTEEFIKDNNLLPVLFPKLWDEHAGRWKPGKKVPSLERGFYAFDEIRIIDRDANNDFVTLQIDWPNRVQAAELTNQMVQRLNNELRKRAIASADASLAYLQRELNGNYDVATRESISRLIESEIRRKMLANVSDEFELRFVDKATVPDADYPTRPKKALMAAVGLTFGALIGVAVSLLLYRRELSQKGQF